MDSIERNYPRADEDTNWDEVAWASVVDNDMVTHLDSDTLQELIDELDDAVARICEAYDIK